MESSPSIPPSQGYWCTSPNKPDGLRSLHVWESEDACNQFGEVLAPILQEVGICEQPRAHRRTRSSQADRPRSPSGNRYPAGEEPGPGALPATSTTRPGAWGGCTAMPAVRFDPHAPSLSSRRHIAPLGKAKGTFLEPLGSASHAPLGSRYPPASRPSRLKASMVCRTTSTSSCDIASSYQMPGKRRVVRLAYAS